MKKLVVITGASSGIGLDAGKIAECALFVYCMPQDVCVREIVIAKTKQQD